MRTRCDKSNVDLQDFCCKEQKNKKNLSFAGVCACVFVNFETKWHLEVAYEIESRQKKKKKKKKKNSQKKKKTKTKYFSTICQQAHIHVMDEFIKLNTPTKQLNRLGE
jgi:hypothetical protein